MEGANYKDLSGKVCVLTGGGGAIGGSLALYLAKQGLKMVILDLNAEAAKKVAGEIKEATGNEAMGLSANVLERASLEAVKEEVNKKYGKIDFLINAAGGNAPGGTTALEMLDEVTEESLKQSFYGMDPNGFKFTLELNILGTVLPSMVFTTDMLETGGAVINFSSMSAYHPLTRVGAYSAAKSSVINFTEWLAVHLAKKNVRVNAVAPGFFVGEQNRFLLYDEKTGDLSARGEKIINATPMGRFGDYDEIHGSVLFLLSGMSKFITGVCLPIDGGFNAYSGV